MNTYLQWPVYDCPLLVLDGETIQTPPEWVCLSDIQLYYIIIKIDCSEWNWCWLYDFDSNECVRSAWLPIVPIVVIQAHSHCWVPVFTGYYALTGDPQVPWDLSCLSKTIYDNHTFFIFISLVSAMHLTVTHTVITLPDYFLVDMLDHSILCWNPKTDTALAHWSLPMLRDLCLILCWVPNALVTLYNLKLSNCSITDLEDVITGCIRVPQLPPPPLEKVEDKRPTASTATDKYSTTVDKCYRLSIPDPDKVWVFEEELWVYKEQLEVNDDTSSYELQYTNNAISDYDTILVPSTCLCFFSDFGVEGTPSSKWVCANLYDPTLTPCGPHYVETDKVLL